MFKFKLNFEPITKCFKDVCPKPESFVAFNMRFFSWLIQGTNRSVSNYYSTKPVFPVFMIDNKAEIWKEYSFEGYGVFGGKDYYELMTEINGLTSRDEAINLYYNSKKTTLFPNLVKHQKQWQWKNEKPKSYPYKAISTKNP